MNNDTCSVIVTYNIGKDLLKCFHSITSQVNEVVFVDNGSDTETVSMLRAVEKQNKNVKVFYNEENIGIASALNVGVRYAIEKDYKWILTLDHDSEATPNMIDRLVKAYNELTVRRINKIAIVSTNLFDVNLQEYQTGQSIFACSEDVAEVRHVLTSGSLINLVVFQEVGLFEERLFLYYVDDDFCLRCRNKGWKIFICRSATLLHREGDKEVRSFCGRKFIYRNYDFRARYYIARNSVHMFLGYFSSREYNSCVRVIGRLCREVNKVLWFGNNRTRLFRFMLRGIADGLLGRYGKLECEQNG